MDERIALRVGALRLARRRGRTREAAWAAARLRLAGVTLEPAEARFARDVRVKFGRALRVARRRGPQAPANIAMPLLAAERRSRIRTLLAALVAAILLLGALFIYVREREPAGAPEGALPASQAAVATPPPPLRGRTQPGVAAPVAVVVVEATPAPEEPSAPPATPGPPGNGTGTVGGGTGGGGSGGGTGTGNGRGTPAPTASPSPTPKPSPTPTFSPSPVAHVTGRVVTRNGAPIPNVCVSIGNLTVPTCITHTAADGTFAVDLPVSRSNFTFSFIMPGYRTATRTVQPSVPSTFPLGDIRLLVG